MFKSIHYINRLRLVPRNRGRKLKLEPIILLISFKCLRLVPRNRGRKHHNYCAPSLNAIITSV